MSEDELNYWNEKRVLEIASDDTMFIHPYLEQLKEASDLGAIRDATLSAPHTRYTVHPSGITHCLRKHILERHFGEREFFPAAMSRLSSMGNFRHDKILTDLQSQGWKIIGEMRMEDKATRTTMRIDGTYITKSPEDDDFVLEIKTVGEYPFKTLSKEGMPRPGDLLQLQWYMDITGIETGILFYESRSNGEQELMSFRADEGIQKYMRERIQAVLDSDISHEVVSRPYPKSYWMCQKKMCGMKRICDSHPDEGGPMECGGEDE